MDDKRLRKGRSGARGEKYVDMAVRAEEFIRTALVRNGRLLVRYRDGEAAGEGKLDDYACYSPGSSGALPCDVPDRLSGQGSPAGRTRWLSSFWIGSVAASSLNAKDAERLIVRTKETYDGRCRRETLRRPVCCGASCPAHR